jgi:hypothetical protein
MDSQFLRDYSADHLHYELSMLYDTADRLADAGLDNDPVALNAFVESFAIHARALAAFLYPDPEVKRKTDVKSDHYVRDTAEWEAARGKDVPPLLQEVMTRTAKEIAHLTTERLPANSREKKWTPKKILRVFDNPLRVFVDHSDPQLLDPKVISLVRLKADKDTASAPPHEDRAWITTATRGLSVPPTHFPRTDVSTPNQRGVVESPNTEPDSGSDKLNT